MKKPAKKTTVQSLDRNDLAGTRGGLKPIGIEDVALKPIGIELNIVNIVGR